MAKLVDIMYNNHRLVLTLFFLLLVSESVHGDYYFPGSTNSYGLFRKWHACMDSVFSFEFKTQKDSGLLMYVDDGGTYDFFEVRLMGGSVSLRLNIVDGRDGSVNLESGIELDDNRWHKIEIIRNRMETTLAVDGESDGKVSFGSDFNFGDVRNNSAVYFGGLPSSFRGYGLHKLALPSAFYEKKFTGSIRNILLSNCTCEVIRMGAMVNGEDVINDPPEACELNDPCSEGCVCISQDNAQTKCDCSAANCDVAPTVHYHLPFDLVNGRTLVNPSGLDAEVKGVAKLVPGVAGNAIELDGKNNWVRLVGPGHRYECFGDLQLCDNGYTMGLWINITDPGFNDIIYLSNGGHTARSHGVAMMYRNGHLEMRFRRSDGKEWRTKTDDILPYHWYHVAATWSTDNGLKLFINGNQVDHDPNPTIRDPRLVTQENNDFLLGRANDGQRPSQTGTIVMDEFHFWSEEKTPQQIRNAGPFYKFFLPMSWLSSSGVLLRSPAMVAEAKGGAKLVNAKIGTGIQLNGINQYVQAGSYNDVCMGDIGQCWYGLTLGAWINVPSIQNGAYIIYTGPNGLSLMMENNALVGRFVWNNKQWKVIWPGFKAGKWYFVELTWSKNGGAKMYVDLQEVSAAAQSLALGAPPRDPGFYLGRSPDAPLTYADVMMDDVELWYGDRDTLVRTKFILRESPYHLFFDFNSMQGNTLVNSRDDINLTVTAHGTPLPSITAGKIFGAVNLLGTGGQYIDFNQQGKTCFSNVNHCYFGFLLALWVNSDVLVNKAYYFSTGMNGLDVWYENGNLNMKLSTWTRTWKLSTNKYAAGRWQFLEIDWDPYYGLSIWLDLKFVLNTKRFEPRDLEAGYNYNAQFDNFFIGRGNFDMATAGYQYGMIAADYAHYYYSSRRALLAFDWILRAKPPNFHFGFDAMNGTRIAHPSFRIDAYGAPKLVLGKLHKAVVLDGNIQYLDFGSWDKTCFGNLSLCHHGFTWSAYFKFRDFKNDMFYWSTGLLGGFILFYRDGFLNAQFSVGNQVWRVGYPVQYDRNGLRAINRQKWYYIEFSWHPEHGLNMYVNNQYVLTSAAIATVGGRPGVTYSSYLGRGNPGDTYDGGFKYADATVDELEVWYGRREEMIAHRFMIRGQIDYIKIPFEEWERDRLEHSSLDIRLFGNPTRWPGKIGDAVYLNGNRQWVDLGDNGKSCLGNVDLCPYGQTVLFWLNPKDLQDETYVVSSKDYDIYTKNGRLYARYIVDDRKWEVSTDDVRAGVWQRVDVTWHPEKGLAMFVDNDKVDEVSTSVPVVPTDRTDTHVYVGRTSDMTNKKYFNGIVDELDVWFAPRSHLVANNYFRYENIDRHTYVFERIEDNKVVSQYDQDVVVYGNPRIIDGRTGKAITLNGINDYLDFGENVTCKGDLYDCFDGVTIRILMKPNSIRDRQYIFSGNNGEMYFDNGRLVSKFFTRDEEWETSADGLEPGKWYMATMSWYPADGVHLHVNCIKKGHAAKAGVRPRGNRYNRRVYLGRANSDMVRDRYGDVEIEKFEIWKGRRDYMEAYGLLTNDCDPKATKPPVTEDSKPIIQCTGRTILDFDNSRMNYRRNQNEVLTIDFNAGFKDGLIWFTQNDAGKVFVTLQNGRLVVDFDYRLQLGRRFHSITSAAPNLNDGAYHKVKVTKRGREVTVEVDGRYVERKRLEGDFYLAHDDRTYLCGTPRTNQLTNYEIDDNYVGKIREATLEGDPSTPITDYLDLVSKRPLDPWVSTTPDLVVKYDDDDDEPQTTRKPPPSTKLPPVAVTPTATFLTEDSVVKINRWDALRTGTLEFRFKTSDPEGLIFYNGAGSGRRDFVAVELFDGDLFLVANLGYKTHRVRINPTSPVNDGVYHTVKIEHDRKKFVATVDGRETEMNIPGQDSTLDLNTVLFVGGIDDFNKVDWHVWTRKGFRGCLRDLKVNFKSTDLQGFADHQRVRGVTFGSTCAQPPLRCNDGRQCTNGRCADLWASHRCHCAGTQYEGDRCGEYSKELMFNGDEVVHVNYTKPVTTHTNTISVRFRTSRPDGLLFTTDSEDQDFISLCLKNGRARLTVKDLGTVKYIEAGSALNDNQWHTAWVRRRAEYMEVWIDGQLQHTVDTLPKSEFDINVSDIYFGRYPSEKRRTAYQTCENFIGKLQTATVDHKPVFGKVGQGDDGSGVVVTTTSGADKPPEFKPVQFVEPDAYVGVREMPEGRDVSLNLMFKTLQDDGLLLFSGKPNDYFIAMELVDGWLHYLFNNRTNVETVRIGSPKRLNDNAWHRVELKMRGPSGPTLSVDDTITILPRGTKFRPSRLSGPVFIGGLPQHLFPALPPLVNSRTGFKGCFSSWVVNKKTLDLLDRALIRSGFIQEGCNVSTVDIVITMQEDLCNPNPCKRPGAVCRIQGNGFYCDCNMTAHVTTNPPDYCGFEAEGIRFAKSGKPGIVNYTYVTRPSTSEDNLAIGFMTWNPDGTIFRVEGRNYTGVAGDFLEVRLEDGYVVTEYKYTGGSGRVVDRNQKYNDAVYHVIRFMRRNDRVSQWVDSYPVSLATVGTGSSGQINNVIFVDQANMYAGGRQDFAGKVYSNFDGIIAGVYWNGIRLMDWAIDRNKYRGDAFVAPHLFFLPRPGGPGGTGAVIGGGKGSAGGVLYAAPGAPVAAVGAAATTAGIILGILAALLLLATALMWALYRCKPGLLPCAGYSPVKTVPVAAGAGAGAGKVKFINGTAAGANGVFVAGGGGTAIAAGTATGAFAAADTIVVAGGGGGVTTKTIETETYDGVVVGAGGGGGGGRTMIVREAGYGAGFGAAGAGGHRTVATNTLDRSAGAGGGGFAAGYAENWSESYAAGGGGGAAYAAGGGGGTITTTTTEVTETLLGGPAGGYGYGAGGYGAGAGGYGAGAGGGGYGESYSSNTYSAYGAQGGGGGAGYGAGYGTGGAAAYGAGAGYASSYSGGTLNKAETMRMQSPPPIASPNVVSIAPEVRVESFVITANGRYVITGSSMGPPQVWDSKTGDLIRSMSGDRLGSTDVHLACAESILAGLVTVEKRIDASTIKRNRQLDMTLQLWGFESGMPLEMPSLIHATATVLMHDRDRLILGRTERHGAGVSVVMWDLGGNQQVDQYKYNAPAGSCDIVTHVDVTNDDKYAVAAFKHLFTGSTNFAVFDLNNPRGAPLIYAADAEPDCLCLLDHHEALTGTGSGELVVWSLRTGMNLRTWGVTGTSTKAPHADRITAMTQSKDYIVAASADCTLTMWDKDTEEIKHRLVGHVDEVWCCAVTSTQDLVISGSRDNTIRLWRCKDGTEVSSFNALMDIFSLKASIDKRVIVALGDRDHSRKLIMLQVLHSRQPKHRRLPSDVMA